MNKQITEDYCSFEIAKLLKEKGFKQECDYATSWYAAEYYKNSALGEWFEGEHQIIKDIDDKCTISYLSDKDIFIPAPSQSLALKWLREVHDLHIIVYPWQADNEEKAIHWCCTVYKSFAHLGNDVYTNETPKSYEEAVEAALLYVLKNLI